VTPLLGIYPKEHKSGYNKNTCMLTFIAQLFRIAKLWKQFRCPSTDKWVKKCDIYVCISHAYISESYSVIWKNDTRWFEGKRMQLEDIMLSETSQVQKDKCFMFSLICG
jgi:hypothetical protein